ncbi:hypothetical protein A2678_01520 [Candidatus Kaiserbacteria bacterium RIFCSPHIGHO2_01_FULL_53_31]|uniref:Methyltransferase type 12 domain-containing protein n=1 Tax=Candidatus Kaiserbacteria bacterium RIFCSPHIGHO2_01_FULL_53_31 TaxID=1798481 RepID=A0A1F6CGC8_9BACT|nr:MAG: hypothetical protein A2678_01520 [Candidatus Kaiserbacteria bacterium RIFCSPHIGHO2_01_FULL_53_31]
MKRRTKLNPRDAVGGRWEMGSKGQIELLQRYGLMPQHTVLDVGCGSLRGGLNIIKYLETGNYTGVDISEEILEAGREFLRGASLEGKRPNLFYTDNIEFKEVQGKTFDYLLAISVLTHMPPEDIETLFANLHKVMGDRSVFLATVFLSKTGSIYDTVMRRNFFYPYEWFRDMGARYGLTVERDEKGDAKQNLLVIRKQAAST